MTLRAALHLRRATTLLVTAVLLTVLFAGCIGSRGDDAAAPIIDPVDPELHVESFDGRLVCGVAVSGSASNPCALAPGSRNYFEAKAPRNTETLLVGLTWKTSPGSSDTLKLNVESTDYSPVEGHGVRYASTDGPPDLVIRLEASQLEEMSGEKLNKTSLPLQLRVFPGNEGVVADQPFALQLVAYIGERAPEDASPFGDH